MGRLIYGIIRVKGFRFCTYTRYVMIGMVNLEQVSKQYYI